MNDTTPGGKPNIRQVAAVAGVSHMTVSRVLNDHPNIKESTRKKVLEVIEQLNYRPNTAARALATQKNRRIGVMIESAREFGPLYTLRAVEDAARNAGYGVTSVPLSEHGALAAQDAVDYLISQGIDAVCVIAPRSSSVAALRKISLGVPTLVIKGSSDPNFLTRNVGTAMFSTWQGHLTGWMRAPVNEPSTPVPVSGVSKSAPSSLETGARTSATTS
jgi:DNA-binding LacI/PurR family transcriptional regulator